MNEDAARMRTHGWLEPLGLAESARELSGQEYYAAWMKGELVPPMAATLGFELADFDEGYVEIRCRVGEFHYSPYGMAHGGLAASLLDSASGCAVHTRLAAGTGYATVSLSLNYLRAATLDSGELLCCGRVAHMGGRVAVSNAELVDAEGRNLATATSTCLILRPDR